MLILSVGAVILSSATGCVTLSKTPTANEPFKDSFYREFPSPVLTADEGRIDFAAYWCSHRPADVPKNPVCGD